MNRVNILIIEPYDFFRITVSEFIKNSQISPKINNIFSASNIESAKNFIITEQIDLAIIDIDTTSNTIFFNESLKKYFNNLKIIFYTMYDFDCKYGVFSSKYKIIRKDSIFDKLVGDIEDIISV